MTAFQEMCERLAVQATGMDPTLVENMTVRGRGLRTTPGEKMWTNTLTTVNGSSINTTHHEASMFFDDR